MKRLTLLLLALTLFGFSAFAQDREMFPGAESDDDIIDQCEVFLADPNAAAADPAKAEVCQIYLEDNFDNIEDPLSELLYCKAFQQNPEVLAEELDAAELAEANAYCGSLTVPATISSGDFYSDELDYCRDVTANPQSAFDLLELNYCRLYLGAFEAVQAGQPLSSVLNTSAAPLSTSPSETAPTVPTSPASNPLSPSSSTAANPLASEATYAGRFTDGDLTLILTSSAGAYAGELELNGQIYPVEATVNNGQLEGVFTSSGASFSFTATLEGELLALDSDGNLFTLTKVPQNPLDN